MTQRVVLVSGATRGIGAAVAARLASSGWTLSLGAREPKSLEGSYAGAQVVRHDAFDADESGWAKAARDRFGRIDAVVCCAGIMEPATVIDVDDAALDRMWVVNVKSPRRLVRAAWPDLVSDGSGRVVLLASLSGKRVKSPVSGPYAMTKHAVVAMGHAIRRVGWEAGIRATAICPGFVDTDMARAITDRAAERMTPPTEIAKLVELALDAPANAVLAELTVNCQLEELY